MSDTVTVNVHGLKELAQALTQLPQKLAGKALGASVAAGAAIIRNQAVANAKAIFNHPTGAVEKSIVAYRLKWSRPDHIGYAVGVTMDKQWPRRRKKAASGVMGRTGRSTVMTGSWSNSGAYWWRFTEFNTVHRNATPWLRPAFDNRSGEALVMIKLMLEKAVVIAAAQVPKWRGNG